MLPHAIGQLTFYKGGPPSMDRHVRGRAEGLPLVVHAHGGRCNKLANCKRNIGHVATCPLFAWHAWLLTQSMSSNMRRYDTQPAQ
eukprot:COSAG02_NODE_3893_length_6074_cov_4.113138_4_plen_85_part_00